MSQSPVYNRRHVIKGMTATLGVLSLRGFTVHGKAAAHFTHGVASGDPLTDRVILWTRVLPGDGQTGELPVNWKIARDPDFKDTVQTGVGVTSDARDYTVKIDATGLEPGRDYWYQFSVADVTSPIGRTCTLPAGSVERFRMAVCSCSNYPQGYFNAYGDMARADVDVVVHLGDYIYEYPDGVYSSPVAVEELGRRVKPANELLTLEDYRTRYGLYRTDPDLQAAHAAHPWICVWDDHELANDTWKQGAENHNEGEGDFAERIAIARKVYHEWMPIRTAAQSDQAPIYRRFQVGGLLDLLMLDTRLHGRDQQLDYERDIAEAGGVEAFIRDRLTASERTILGADQEAWLGNELARSGENGVVWQVLGQQVLMGKVVIPKLPEDAFEGVEMPARTRRWVEGMSQLADYQMPWNLDAWNGYPACRERVYAALGEYANNAVSLAGDTHNAWYFNLADAKGEPVGVEVGTHSISSPGLETYLPLPADDMRALLMNSTPELVDINTHQRGWTEVTFTPEEMTSQWRFVSTVLERDYTVTTGPLMRCKAGARRFS